MIYICRNIGEMANIHIIGLPFLGSCFLIHICHQSISPSLSKYWGVIDHLSPIYHLEE